MPVGGGPTLYTAKLRFQGSAGDAAQQLSAYFSAAGWQAMATDLGAGASSVVITRPDGASGFLVVDPEPGNTGASRIVVTASL